MRRDCRTCKHEPKWNDIKEGRCTKIFSLCMIDTDGSLHGDTDKVYSYKIEDCHKWEFKEEPDPYEPGGVEYRGDYFKDIKVGDKVFDLIYGKGTVDSFAYDLVIVKLDSGLGFARFDFNGVWAFSRTGIQTLFYGEEPPCIIPPPKPKRKVKHTEKVDLILWKRKDGKFFIKGPICPSILNNMNDLKIVSKTTVEVPFEWEE